jgi:membrane protein DedA with SNARE-associated domain
VGALLEGFLNVEPLAVYLLVFALVFAEDALFIGFVIPGETAAVLGGVIAGRGNVDLWLMIAIVIAAAITGDSVGYEVGRRYGTRITQSRLFRKRQGELNKARELLGRRGGTAVFLGRFTAFFRAVMPALAGTARMPYPRFLLFNIAGGLVWGAGFVLLGYFAGNSYETVARTVGQSLTLLVIGAGIVSYILWRIVRRRRARTGI